MTIRAEVASLVTEVEDMGRTVSAFGIKVRRILKSSLNQDEIRALFGAFRTVRETVAREVAAIGAEVVA